MQLRFHNTLTGKKEEFKPVTPGKVGMYVCGPTVYNFDHIGHARTYVVFDCLKRLLEFSNYQVKYVQNITDVGHLVDDGETGEDKLEKQAKTEHRSPEQVASFYEQAHWADMKSIGNVKPDQTPRASEYIPKIIEHIKLLLDNGFAYAKGGNVYFAVEHFKEYGKLSHRKLADMVTGTRIEQEKEKRHPADFALWKVADGNQTRLFDSPWGKGIPGWHIECSVMSADLLGQPFDIHGSAVEHVFPHHENEIAQSEAAYDKPLANYWLHTGMLSRDGKKMSKSLGNGILIHDLIKDYPLPVIRLALLSAHYRKPLDYTTGLLKQWSVIWFTWRKKLSSNDQGANSEAIKQQVIELLADDFNTPGALGLLQEKQAEISSDDLKELLELLGIYQEGEEIPEKINQLVKTRNQARESRNWELADKLRTQIDHEGYILEDTGDQTKVYRK